MNADPVTQAGRRRSARKRLESAGARAACALIMPLPRAAVRALARGLGELAYRCTPRLRRVGEANLDVVFGSGRSRAEKRRILRAAYRNMALTALDVIWFSRRPADRLTRWIRFDRPIAGVAPGGPALCLTAHLGNWELLGQAASLAGMPLHSVATPLKNPDVDARLNRAREITGQRIVPRKGALRALLAVLRDGGRVALLLDQNTSVGKGGEFHDFFGLPATVSPIAGLLACRRRAAVAFGFCVPQPDGTYRVLLPDGFEAPGGGGGDSRAAARCVTRRILRMYEEQILARPECWLWMYKRWKHIRPGDDPGRYPFYSMRLDPPASTG